MKSAVIVASSSVLLLSTGVAEARTLVLTMETCVRSAAVAYLGADAAAAPTARQSLTTKGWFSPREPVPVDVGDSGDVYLHVSFWDHGVFAATRFTRDDASFCVDRIGRSFETRSEIRLAVGTHRFMHAFLNERGQLERHFFDLPANRVCPDANDLTVLGNFEKVSLRGEVTKVDICKL